MRPVQQKANHPQTPTAPALLLHQQSQRRNEEWPRKALPCVFFSQHAGNVAAGRERVPWQGLMKKKDAILGSWAFSPSRTAGEHPPASLLPTMPLTALVKCCRPPNVHNNLTALFFHQV